MRQLSTKKKFDSRRVMAIAGLREPGFDRRDDRHRHRDASRATPGILFSFQARRPRAAARGARGQDFDFQSCHTRRGARSCARGQEFFFKFCHTRRARGRSCCFDFSHSFGGVRPRLTRIPPANNCDNTVFPRRYPDTSSHGTMLEGIRVGSRVIISEYHIQVEK